MPIILSIACKVKKKADMSKSNKEHKPSKFRLALIDNKTHKQLWTLHFTRTSIVITIITTLTVICLGVYSMIAFTPLKTFIPGYPDAHSKRAAIQNAITIDSLENVIYRWGLYSENLKRVLSGDRTVRLDSLINSIPAKPKTEADLEQIRKRDSLLRENVHEEEKFGISERNKRNLPVEGMHFFSPLKGVISQGYNPIDHPYLDITAAAGTVVKSVLDGTVVFDGWSEDTGYTIQIQHDSDVITIYKHNEKLLKKTGDKVTAGAPIALVGNTGSETTGAHLHFELWYKGEALDPTAYINF